MHGIESIASIAALSGIAPTAKIVVMSGMDSHANALATLPASLHGFLPKSLTTAQITLALSGLIWQLDRTVGGAIASRILGRCGSG